MSLPITGRPTLPDLSDPVTFNSRAQNLLNWITGSMLDQFAAVDPADWFAVQSSGADFTANKVLRTEALTSVFTGAVTAFAMSTAPAGWLKCNGAAVSRTTYAALFAKIGVTFGAGDGSTTFTLPDMRGVFARGWDDGRGVDSGRGLGSYQADAVQDHAHSAWSSTNGSHTHYIGSRGKDGNGSAYAAEFSYSGYGGVDNYPYTAAAGDHGHTITVGGMTSGSFAAETRVKNVALLYCIKY